MMDFLIYIREKYLSLINLIRIMIIKSLKKVLESQLKPYYMEFNFATIDNKNHFKLPLIAYLVDEDESVALFSNISRQLFLNFNPIGSCKRQLISLENINRTIETIHNTQEINGSVTIKMILERTEIIDGKLFYKHNQLISKNGMLVDIVNNLEFNDINNNFKVNTIKTGGTPFETIKDLFVVKINKKILE